MRKKNKLSLLISAGFLFTLILKSHLLSIAFLNQNQLL